MRIWRRVTCWISKATRALAHDRALAATHARIRTQKFVILLFHSNNGFVNAPHFWVIRALPVLQIVILRPKVMSILWLCS
jgi:hypothetical protein